MRTYGLRFDVNCSILFTELPLLKRPAAARAAGFGAVEFWWPFAEPVPPDREVDSFVEALGDAGVRLILLNFVAGDMAAGERGLLSLPGRSAKLFATGAPLVIFGSTVKTIPAAALVMSQSPFVELRRMWGTCV